MSKSILVINGNPARQRETFSAALTNAYRLGAEEGGHQVRTLKIADLAFDPILHEGCHAEQPPEPDLVRVQDAIKDADHVVFIYPMWQFGVPALLKGFCERVFTPGFAYAIDAKNPLDAALLKGRSVRLIQTMGMPGAFYSFVFHAHGGKAFTNLFAFCGFAPVKLSVFGMVEGGEATRERHLTVARRLGRKGV